MYLRLSYEEFLDISPRHFSALMKAYKAGLESQEFMLAQLTSWVANTGFRSTEKPTKPTDFMPSQWSKTAKQKASKPIRMTAKKRLDMAEYIMATLGKIAKVAN